VFFLESTFLGAFLFGEKQLGPKLHWLSAWIHSLAVPDGEPVLRSYTLMREEAAQVQLKDNPSWCRKHMDCINPNFSFHMGATAAVTVQGDR
jgi:Cytochrome bd terminal oxidase subunit I